MNNYIKIGVAVICLFILGSVIYDVHQMRQKNLINPPILMPVQQKIDKNGNTYTQIEEKQYTETDMKKLSDSLHKVYGGKIQQVVKVVYHLDTVFKAVPFYKDTMTNEMVSDYKDRYITDSFSSPIGSDSGTFSIKLTNDTVSFITTKKRHLFKTNYLVDFTHSNPYVKTTEGSAYTYTIPRNILTFGPYIGYDLIQKKPSIGIACVFNLFSIKSR